MLRTLLVRTATAATVAAFAAFGTAPVLAETVEGDITHVELHDTPRHVKVRTGGDEVQITISNRTNVTFEAAYRGYFSEELSSLKPGMRARVTYNTPDQPAQRVAVLSVPGDLHSEAVRRFEAGRGADNIDGTEMKVRLTEVNRTRGSFRADFQGVEKTFFAEDPQMLSGLNRGEMVVLKVRANDRSAVTDIRSASLEGRVVEVDRTSGRVHVVVDGREQTYKIDRLKGLRLEEGDLVRFSVEERPNGEQVMTDINKVTGVGKVR
jgi:hypothetical protein